MMLVRARYDRHVPGFGFYPIDRMIEHLNSHCGAIIKRIKNGDPFVFLSPVGSSSLFRFSVYYDWALVMRSDGAFGLIPAPHLVGDGPPQQHDQK